MTRSGFLFVLAFSALLGGAVVSAVSPSIASAGNDAKDAKDAEKLKAAREKFRKDRKAEGKLPFFDLSYAADPAAVKETRWSQSDPPTYAGVTEEQGVQFQAAWSPDISKGAAISMIAIKYIHKSPDGKSEYSKTFDLAGISCKCADKDKMLEGSYQNEIKSMTDVVVKKCVPPKKKSCGPAEAFASVLGTSAESKKRERKDFYMWMDSNRTWIIIVTITDKYLDDPLLIEKAEELIGTIKELKKAPTK